MASSIKSRYITAVNFLPNFLNRRPTGSPWERNMGHLCWFQSMAPPFFLLLMQLCTQLCNYARIKSSENWGPRTLAQRMKNDKVNKRLIMMTSWHDTFLALLVLSAGNPLVPSTKAREYRTSIASLLSTWVMFWTNNNRTPLTLIWRHHNAICCRIDQDGVKMRRTRNDNGPPIWTIRRLVPKQRTPVDTPGQEHSPVTFYCAGGLRSHHRVHSCRGALPEPTEKHQQNNTHDFVGKNDVPSTTRSSPVCVWSVKLGQTLWAVREPIWVRRVWLVIYVGNKRPGIGPGRLLNQCGDLFPIL